MNIYKTKDIARSIGRYIIVLLVLNAILTFCVIGYAGREVVFTLTNRDKVDALMDKIDAQIMVDLSIKEASASAEVSK